MHRLRLQGSRLHGPEIALHATVIVDSGMMRDNFQQSLMATAKAANMPYADMHLVDLLSFHLGICQEALGFSLATWPYS